MVWMFALFGLIGGLDAVSEDPGLDRVLSLAMGLIFGGLCVRWCDYDALERGGTNWRYLAATMVLCPGPLLAFPAYLLLTRGLQRGALAVLGAVAFFVVLIAAYVSVLVTIAVLSQLI
jgi:hypothetical protein